MTDWPSSRSSQPAAGNPARPHSRAWRIPAASAEAFAQAMTERYGQPIEGLSTVGAMQRRAETNAADGFLFNDPEVPGE